MLVPSNQEMQQKSEGQSAAVHHPFYQFKLVQPAWREPRPLSVATVFVDSDDEVLSSDEGDDNASARSSLKSVSHWLFQSTNNLMFNLVLTLNNNNRSVALASRQ